MATTSSLTSATNELVDIGLSWLKLCTAPSAVINNSELSSKYPVLEDFSQEHVLPLLSDEHRIRASNVSGSQC